MGETAARTVGVKLKFDISEGVANAKIAGKTFKDFGDQVGRSTGSAAKATKDLGAAAAQSSAGMDSATKSTKAFGDQTRKTQQDVEQTKRSTQDAGAAASQLGAGMAVAGAALAAGIGLAVNAFADFDKEMSNVKAVSNATAGEMQQLTDAALAAGAATKFSAADAATAEAELAKAGISTRDILGGALKGSLDLAAAGSLNLADAATVSANAMNIFSLKGQDVSHIADVLASGANKSAADVDQLGQALQQSGLVAAQMGLNLEDTVGILAAFADNGLKGSDAGTSFKTMLQRLVPSSKEAATAMKDIGFSAYDAQGNLKGIDQVAEDLQKGLTGLTQKQKDQTLATIFGSDAVRGANVLFKLGGQGVRDYTAAVNDQGAAARVAATQMDNLSGDLENLRGSFETALIKGGSGANDALRGVAQAATEAVNSFSELPDSVQSSVIQLAGLASGALLLGGGLLTAIPKIVATREAIDALSVASPRAAGALGALGKAGLVVGIAAAAVEINNVAAAARVAQPPVEDLAKGLADIGDGATASKDFGAIFARGMGPFERTFENANDALADFGANAKFALDHNFIEGVFGQAAEAGAVFESRIKQIDAALVTLVQGGRANEAAAAVAKLEKSAQDAGLQAGRVTDQLTGYKAAAESAAVANGKYADSTGDVANAAGDAVGSGKLLGDEIKEQEQAAKDAQQAFDDLTKSVKDYGDQVAAALSATSGYEAAIDAAADVAAKRNEIQQQINELSGGGKAEIVSKFDKADAKLQLDYAERIKKANDDAEKARLRTELAERLADSRSDRKKALDDNIAQIARLQEQQTQYAATLDLTTEAGRRNQQMLLDIATNAKNAAVENFKNGQSVDTVKDAFDGARETFIKQAVAFGTTKEAAAGLADSLGLTEGNLNKLRGASPVDVKVNADTDAANTALSYTNAQLDALGLRPATATVTADTTSATQSIDDTNAQLDATDARVATATITADAAKALTDASTFDALMGQIDGKTANATVNLQVKTSIESALTAGIDEQVAALSGTLGQRFAVGGYTGDGGKFEPKGVVHGGEYVFTKEETAKAGVVNLKALARSLRGYAAGGYVTPQFADRGMVSSAVSNTYGGAVSHDNRAYIDKVYGLTLDQVQRDTDRRSRLHALGRRGAK